MQLHLAPPPDQVPPEFAGLRITELQERFGRLRPAFWLPHAAIFFSMAFGGALGWLICRAIDRAILAWFEAVKGALGR